MQTPRLLMPTPAGHTVCRQGSAPSLELIHCLLIISLYLAAWWRLAQAVETGPRVMARISLNVRASAKVPVGANIQQ